MAFDHAALNETLKAIVRAQKPAPPVPVPVERRQRVERRAPYQRRISAPSA